MKLKHLQIIRPLPTITQNITLRARSTQMQLVLGRDARKPVFGGLRTTKAQAAV